MNFSLLSVLKMGTECFSKKLIHMYQIIWVFNLKNHNPYITSNLLEEAISDVACGFVKLRHRFGIFSSFAVKGRTRSRTTQINRRCHLFCYKIQPAFCSQTLFACFTLFAQYSGIMTLNNT